MANQYIIHYAELGLKGHNRINFERRLVSNIDTALGDLGDFKVRRFHSYVMVSAPDEASTSEIEHRLSRIPGIAYFAPTTVTPLDIAAMTEAALDMAKDTITSNTSFRVRTTRGNKQFPIKSMDVDRQVGGEVQDLTQAPVDLSNPDVTLSIQIYDKAYLFTQRIRGLGGLPLGSSGNVMALFSGGIDSPVAAHLIMKRGCAVDFVHFHLLRGPQQIRRAKIVTMARQVLSPHRTPSRLYMVSAAPFEVAMAPLDSRVATVVFRRFIVRAADRLARHRRAQALITGESVGQVASQTLKNINLIAQATDLPILRPLIAMDKLEIIALAKEIETYELSIQPYKDPCSLTARRPATWAQLKDVLAVEEAIDVDTLLEETLANHVEEIRIIFEEAPRVFRQ